MQSLVSGSCNAARLLSTAATVASNSAVTSVTAHAAKRVLIVGGGALGLFFASKLRKPSILDVTVVDKYVTNQSALTNAGRLIVRDLISQQITHHPEINVKTYSDVQPMEAKYDLIFMAVKNMYMREALKEAIPFLDEKNGSIMSIQNGMGHFDVLKEFVPANRILLGVTMTAVSMHMSDHNDPDGSNIELDASPGETPVYVAEGMPSPEQAQLLALMEEQYPQFRLEPDIWKVIWKKMVTNCAYNTVSALTKLTIGAINQNAVGLTLMEQIASEVAAIARSEGVHLSDEEALFAVSPMNVGVNKLKAHKTSMLQDIMANRKTEIDYLSGYIVRKGAERGVKVPVSETLYRLIKLYETSLGYPIDVEDDVTSCPLAKYCALSDTCGKAGNGSDERSRFCPIAKQ